MKLHDDVLNENWIKKPHGSLSSFAVAGAGRHRFRSPNIEKEQNETRESNLVVMEYNYLESKKQKAKPCVDIEGD
jgi:hypothetical protein